MKNIYLNHQLTLIPTQDQWSNILNGTLTVIDNLEVLDTKYYKKQFEDCIKKGSLNSPKTLAVLEKRNWQNKDVLYPTIIYWPYGCPKIEDMYTATLESTLFFRVYFKTFHCFKCGLDRAGFALDRDAYIFKNDELNKIYDSYDFFTLRCPNCKDKMRSPGLVELLV